MKWLEILQKYLNFLPKKSNSGHLDEDYSEVEKDLNSEETQDKVLEEFNSASEKNLEKATRFFYHRYELANQNIGNEYLKFGENLIKTILNPGIDFGADSLPENTEEIERAASLIDFDEKHYHHDVRNYVSELEKQQDEILKNSDLIRKKREIISGGRYKNFYFAKDFREGSSFEFSLLKSGIRCAMIITDTFYTRSTDFYKKIISSFERNKISFVEFTNVQPNLDRKLIFRMHEFARDHGVNSLVVVGSMSTVELAKLLLSKLMNPNIVSLHKTREFELAIAEKYSVFSVPTFVVPDPQINSRSVVKNNLFANRFKLWNNVLFLKNEIDDSNGVFYFSEVFNFLGREKILEAMHETFFKLIFFYFDLSAGEDILNMIVENLRKIEKMLEAFYITNEFNEYEKQEFMKIFSFTMDGRIIIDALDFWTVYRLEGALSLLVNSKKSEGLALFMPLFIEVMSKRRIEFKKRALQLGAKFYGCYSVDGFIYRILNHIQKYNLPISINDVQGVTKVNYKFLSDLMGYARIGNKYNPIVKSIIQAVNI